jgi:PAS domain S-box-containing protein
MIRTVDEAGDHFETQHRRKDGSVYDVEISTNGATFAGQKLIFCVCRDISERKQMEMALRESEEKFSVAFRSSPNAICIASIEEDKFIEVNESFTRFIGHPREDIIGHNPMELGLWDSEEDLNRMGRNLQEKGKINNEEYHSRMKSGQVRIGLFSAETINITGKPCVILAITDITEQKQAEDQLKQALADLEHSTAQLKATNQELESFSYSVSHDLRSPLRGIDGFSQALLEDYTACLDETGKDYLNRLRGASQKMGELIDGLLKLSRLTRSEMHPEKIDLSALAEDISARLQETHPDNRVQIIIAPGLSAEGDPQMLRVLLENLLGNAWKFTRKTPRARIEFGSAINDGVPTFFIKDNGAGFDMAYQDKLFGAFQRLHDTTDFPGTGIGLATVQRIINRHGGNIRAEGAVGKGAAFYFTLSQGVQL